MARTTPSHWYEHIFAPRTHGLDLTDIRRVGVLCLLIASILLLVTTISAPVITNIAILKVKLTNHTQIRNSAVNFGTFGHCILDVPPVQ